MSDATTPGSRDLADVRESRAADDGLLTMLRNRKAPIKGDEPLVLQRFRFTGTELRNVNLANTEITESFFDVADLTGASFVGARIVSVEFVSAKLPQVNFTDAELSRVNFRHADLEGSNFTGACLNEVEFRDADLSGTIFDRDATGLNFMDALLVDGMDVRNVEDIDTRDRILLFDRGAVVLQVSGVQGAKDFPRTLVRSR